MILREDWMHVQLEERQEGQIALPDDVKDKLDMEAAVFDVVQVSDAVATVKVGDKVITGALGSMARFIYQTKRYIVVREADVVCIMNRNK